MPAAQGFGSGHLKSARGLKPVASYGAHRAHPQRISTLGDKNDRTLQDPWLTKGTAEDWAELRMLRRAALSLRRPGPARHGAQTTRIGYGPDRMDRRGTVPRGFGGLPTAAALSPAASAACNRPLPWPPSSSSGAEYDRSSPHASGRRFSSAAGARLASRGARPRALGRLLRKPLHGILNDLHLSEIQQLESP